MIDRRLLFRVPNTAGLGVGMGRNGEVLGWCSCRVSCRGGIQPSACMPGMRNSISVVCLARGGWMAESHPFSYFPHPHLLAIPTEKTRTHRNIACTVISALASIPVADTSPSATTRCAVSPQSWYLEHHRGTHLVSTPRTPIPAREGVVMLSF